VDGKGEEHFCTRGTVRLKVGFVSQRFMEDCLLGLGRWRAACLHNS